MKIHSEKQQPAANRLSLAFNQPAPEHPYRYFIAEGESLQKIQDLLQDQKNLDASRQALAQSVGALDLDYHGFKFADEPTIEIKPAVKFRLQAKDGLVFVSDVTNPGAFYPHLENWREQQIKKQCLAIAALPAAETAAAREQLAQQVGASSFDGQFFQFDDWEQNAQSFKYPSSSIFRLASHPAFYKDLPHPQSYAYPDTATDEGFKIDQKVTELSQHQYPEQRFSQWLLSLDMDSNPHRHARRPDDDQKFRQELVKTVVEKIGDQWIIAVPVVTLGIYGDKGQGGTISGKLENWILPPGAKPITVSEYFRILEDAKLVNNTPPAPKP